MVPSLKRTYILSLLVAIIFLAGCPPQRPAKKDFEKRRAAAQNAIDKAADKAPELSAVKPVSQQPARPAVKPQTQRPQAPKAQPPKPATPKVPSMTADEEAVKALVERFGIARNSYKSSPARAINELSIDANILALEDVQLIAKLTGLEKLSFTNCRDFSDEFTKELLPLKDSLTSLKIGNSPITNSSAEIIAEFQKLTELNLEKSGGIRDAAC